VHDRIPRGGMVGPALGEAGHNGGTATLHLQGEAQKAHALPLGRKLLTRRRPLQGPGFFFAGPR